MFLNNYFSICISLVFSYVFKSLYNGKRGISKMCHIYDNMEILYLLDTSQALRRVVLEPSFVCGVLACIWDDDPIHLNRKKLYSFFLNCLPVSETLKKYCLGLTANKFVSTEMILMTLLILLKHSRWHSGPRSLLAN